MIRLATSDEVTEINEQTNNVKKIMHEIDMIPQWDQGYPNVDVFSSDILEKNLYVYVEKNTIMGYIVVNNEEDEEAKKVNYREYNSYIVIHRFAVFPEYRNQGIAQKLINYVFEKAKNEKIEAIRIDTQSKNVQMNQLILKMGFEKRGTMELQKNYPLWNAYDIILA